MDQSDLKIMEFLRRTPHARHAEVGKNVNLSRQRVSSRITALQRGRRLRKGYTVDLASLGYKYKYRIDIRIDPVALKEAIEKDSKLSVASKQWKAGAVPLDAPKEAPATELEEVNPQEVLAFYVLNEIGKRSDNMIIEDVAVLLGDPADLCATVRFKDPVNAYHFVTKNLRTIPGINSTSTCWEAWSCAEAQEKRLIAKRPGRSKRDKTSTVSGM